MPALTSPEKFKPLEFFYIIILPILYVVAVFLLRDFNNSNDFQNYLYIYSEVISLDDLFSRNGEFLFNIFLILGNTVGASYVTVYAVLLLISISALNLILYYSRLKFDEKLMVLLFMFSCSGTYFLLANAFRQGLALNLMIAALVASRAKWRLIAMGLAPLFHFSSLFPIVSIMLKKLLSNRFALVVFIIGVLALMPLMQILIFYRFDKYTEEYDYESSFQILRLIIDVSVLILIVINKAKFVNVFAPIAFFSIKIISYNLSPLIYSRISYYDVLICCFLYLNFLNKDNSWNKIILISFSIIYANIIFSIESLNSNFLMFSIQF